jgi:hypothetical protein
VKKPIGQEVLLVASATEALPTQTPIAPQVQQETRQTFTSVDDQQVMAGLNIAMQLLASEPQIGAFEPVEIDDQSIAQLIATDPQQVTAKAPKSPRNSKKQKVAAEPVQLLDLKFLTIPQTATRYQVHTEKALRHLQAQAEAYLRFPKAGLRSNGFIECVFRPDGQRKILIIAEKYEQWLVAHSSQQLKATDHAASRPVLLQQPTSTTKAVREALASTAHVDIPIPSVIAKPNLTKKLGPELAFENRFDPGADEVLEHRTLANETLADTKTKVAKKLDGNDWTIQRTI